MAIFSSFITAALFLAALALCAVGAAFKRAEGLAYLGGLFWAASAVAGIACGVPLSESLVTALLLAAITAGLWGRRGEK